MDITKEELENFNIEMKALLIKYGVKLVIGQNIQVVKEPKEDKTVV